MTDAIDNTLAQILGCPSFLDALGAANIAEARARIVDHDGGVPADHDPADGPPKAASIDGAAFRMDPPFAVVAETSDRPESIGVGVYEYRGQVAVTLFLPRRLEGETAPAAQQRARSLRNRIQDEAEDRFGALNCLATGVVESAGPFLPDDVGADQDALILSLTFHWHT